MKNIELLAPAKDLECAIAAINCGADAVYIGAYKFGARAAAQNSLDDIEKLILYAHKYWCKVYVTVNTILNDSEIPAAEKLINTLYNIGADAIIIQDMGLLELDLPPVPLFASTQTHNNTSQKVEFLEKVGFQRVILARELSLAQISEIKANTNIDLEFFIHGALCVSYSGQCYLSYAIGGRSANRGECAQPCRKLYSLRDSSGEIISKERYLLSLRDLNLSEYLVNLMNAGISSFKIEGRLKDIGYIKNIVSFYRQKIDNILDESVYKKSSSGKTTVDFVPNPDKTFNRGYCDYFLNGRKKEITSFNTPKSIGEPIGKVIDVKEGCFIIDSKIKLNNGDGICFFDKKNILQGVLINKVENNKIYPNDNGLIKKNTFIYRNLDHEFQKKLKNAKIERKISVKFSMCLAKVSNDDAFRTGLHEKNEEIILCAIDEDGIVAQQIMNIGNDIAKNKDMALDNIKKQLSKLGDTEYTLSDIDIKLDNAYFIPIKILNDQRREIINKLRLNREKAYKRENFIITKNDFPYPDKVVDYHANVLNKFAFDFYKRHGVEKIEMAAESEHNSNQINCRLRMKNKKVMTTKHCLKYQFNLCSKNNKNKIMEPFYLIDEQNKEYILKFNCQNCEMDVFF